MALKFLNNGYFAGKVGIGTESPAYKLHTKGTVNGNVNIAVENDSTGTDAYSSYRFKNDSIDTAVMFLTGSNNTNYAGASSLNMYQGTSLPLGFVTNNLLRMIVAGDGNVGIGTTSPASTLDIRGSGGYLQLTSTSLAGSIKSDFNLQLYADPEDGNSSGYQNIQFFTAGASEKMRIDYNGRVGIGTTSPIVKLQVDTGNNLVAAFFKSGANSVPVSVFNAGNTVSTIGFKGSTSTSEYHVRVGADNKDFIAYTNNTEKLRILENGNVGIGTTSPLGRLQVNEYTVASQGNQSMHGEVSVFANDGDESLFLGLKDSAYPNRGWINPVA